MSVLPGSPVYGLRTEGVYDEVRVCAKRIGISLEDVIQFDVAKFEKDKELKTQNNNSSLSESKDEKKSPGSRI